MAELNPVFLDSLTYPAKELRKILGDIYTEGILTSGALAVTQSGTPAMSLSVAAGRAIVTNDEGNFGKYVIENDGPVTKTIAASDPSNPRIDRIIAQIYDSTDISGAVDAWALVILTGTPAGSPVAPTLPSNALNIATVAVAAGVTTIINANITDTRVRSSLIAGIISGDGIATGAEVTTGIANDKIVTPKAIGDALVNTRLLSKVTNSTRDMTALGGDVVYPGIGFMPTSIDMYMLISASIYWYSGKSDSAKTIRGIGVLAAGQHAEMGAFFLYTALNAYQSAIIKSYNADGFTLTWTKNGSPTGTGILYFACYR